ncbi:MAG TPA: tRNA (guanosine(37)-N1)-methyltransferase TrmD [bacterium]
MRFDILSLFPDFFTSPLNAGILSRAIQNGFAEVKITNIRDFASGRHKVVDDMPFGGGPGMVLKPEPVVAALESIILDGRKSIRILLSPDGRKFNQEFAGELLRYDQVVLICGRYEGVDERIRANFVDDDVSIGDYVLSGGEVAAIVILESVVRLVKGVIGNEESIHAETFSRSLLDYPQYTRPREFRGYNVPEVLVSGNHSEIKKWRMLQSLEKTLRKRPDLIDKAKNCGYLTEEEITILKKVQKETIN